MDLVSVIVPVRDGAAHLRETLESVIAQTHRPLECIVVDDGSVDDSADIARSVEGVLVVSQEHAGVSAARNRGVAEARGSLLAFVDADDVWRPDRLALGLEVRRATGAETIVTASRVFGDAPMGRVLALRPIVPTVEDLLAWVGTVPPLGSTLLVTRSAFDAVGGYDDDLEWCEDWALFVRLVARGTVTYSDETPVDYRWHDGNKSRDVEGIERDVVKVYDRLLREFRGQCSPRRARAGMHRYLAATHRRLGRRQASMRHAALSAFLDPLAAVRYVVG